MDYYIIFKGAGLDVKLDDQPEEKENGIQASLTLKQVFHEGTDFSEILEDQFDEILEAIIEDSDNY